MEDFDGNQRYAEYVNVKVADEQVMPLQDKVLTICKDFQSTIFITVFLCRMTTV